MLLPHAKTDITAARTSWYWYCVCPSRVGASPWELAAVSTSSATAGSRLHRSASGHHQSCSTGGAEERLWRLPAVCPRHCGHRQRWAGPAGTGGQEPLPLPHPDLRWDGSPEKCAQTTEYANLHFSTNWYQVVSKDLTSFLNSNLITQHVCF